MEPTLHPAESDKDATWVCSEAILLTKENGNLVLLPCKTTISYMILKSKLIINSPHHKNTVQLESDLRTQKML